MLIRKVIPGFVVQTFDTAKQRFTEQEFIAGEQTDYEDENGDSVDEDLFDGDLPLEMVQPQAVAPVHFVVSVCGSIQCTDGKQPHHTVRLRFSKEERRQAATFSLSRT